MTLLGFTTSGAQSAASCGDHGGRVDRLGVEPAGSRFEHGPDVCVGQLEDLLALDARRAGAGGGSDRGQPHGHWLASLQSGGHPGSGAKSPE